MQILIIEDDRDIRESVMDLLESEGFSVCVAQNGKEALDLLPALEPPCLIFLDLMMPVMNGWEFLEALHKGNTPRLAEIPVYVMSAVSDPAKTAQFAIKGFLKKPVDIDNLLAIAKQYCG